MTSRQNHNSSPTNRPAQGHVTRIVAVRRRRGATKAVLVPASRQSPGSGASTGAGRIVSRSTLARAVPATERQ